MTSRQSDSTSGLSLSRGTKSSGSPKKNEKIISLDWPLSLATVACKQVPVFGFRLPAPFPATAASCTIGSRNYKKVLKLLQE